jgi:hypothetical protein
VDPAIHTGSHDDRQPKGQRKPRYRLPCILVCAISLAHQFVEQGNEAARRWRAGTHALLESPPVHAVGAKAIGREVHASVTQVLSDIAQDVRELHCVAKPARPMQHPFIIDAKETGEPETHDRRYTIGVALEVTHRPVLPCAQVHSHAFHELRGILERNALAAHVTEHIVQKPNTGVMAEVRAIGQLEPAVEPRLRLLHAAVRPVHQVVGIATPRINVRNALALSRRHEANSKPERPSVARHVVDRRAARPRYRAHVHRASCDTSAPRAVRRSTITASGSNASTPMVTATAPHSPAAAQMPNGRRRLTA